MKKVNLQLHYNDSKRFVRLMLIPTLVIMVIMTIYPMLSTVIYSFTDFKLLKPKISFVALENYIDLLGNEYFRNAIWITVKFTICTVICEMLFGLLLALFVNSIQSKFMQKSMRTIVLFPYLLPAVTVALSWRMMLSSNYGIVSQWMTNLGIPVLNWFSDIRSAFWMLVIIDIWQNTPFVFLMLYAALQTVSADQYKAAQIDGARTLSTFWYITLPNLKTSLALCALLRTIDTFRIFDKVNLLTGGGPANSTTTITQFIYKYGIKNLKFGLGSAGALIMTILVLILSILYIKRALGSDAE